MNYKFYSQQGEDFFIFRHFINQNCEDGIFLELGACNGEKYSNTLFFEKNLGFKGILIEPVEEMFKDLKKNRKNNICINTVISTNKSEEVLVNGPVSGISNNMNEEFKKKWHKRTQKKRNINSLKLNDIFKENNINYIDFFSLDVEGSELEVLKTIVWENIDIYLICIELDNLNSEKDNLCRNILLNNNFKFIHKIGLNEFWINESYSRKEKLFNNSNKSIFSGNLNDYGEHLYLESKAKNNIEIQILDYEKKS